MQTLFETESIRSEIALKFPSVPYIGPVARNTANPNLFETQADDPDLVFAGKAWTDISREYLIANHDEYVLMNGLAIRALLAAWLSIAAERTKDGNVVLSSLVFHLGRRSEALMMGLTIFSQEQRGVLRILLKSYLVIDPFDDDVNNALSILEAIR